MTDGPKPEHPVSIHSRRGLDAEIARWISQGYPETDRTDGPEASVMTDYREADMQRARRSRIGGRVLGLALRPLALAQSLLDRIPKPTEFPDHD